MAEASPIGRQRPARSIRGFTPLAAALALAFAVAFALVGCGASDPFDEDGKLHVVATTGMVADIVHHVAGEHAQVIGLMGEGTDPHLYHLSRRDDLTLQHADLIVYSGLLLEGQMGDTFTRMAERGTPVLAVTEQLDDSQLLGSVDYPGQHDPHVWMDVSLWSQCVDVVAEKLSAMDPDHADAYRANAQQYRDQLAELDAYVKQVIGSIPAEQRVLVTAHDAFNYFGRAYELDVRGVQGISTQSEAGARDILDLVDFLVAQRIPAVFFETSVRDHSVRALVEGAANQGHTVVVGGTLFSDAMGPADTYEGTYLGMIDHNATTIARALGGNAPERGWRNKLAAEVNE